MVHIKLGLSGHLPCAAKFRHKIPDITHAQSQHPGESNTIFSISYVSKLRQIIQLFMPTKMDDGIDTERPVRSIAIIGVGQVGAAAAYALILGSVASDLFLVDNRSEWRDGQVRDLSDVAYATGSRTRVRAATHQEARECDIIVITAGSKFFYGIHPLCLSMILKC